MKDEDWEADDWLQRVIAEIVVMAIVVALLVLVVTAPEWHYAAVPWSTR